MGIDDGNLQISFKGGGTFVQLPPKFSSQRDCVFIAWKNSILEYNTKTGKLIWEYKGLADRVAGFGLHNYKSSNCLIAASVSGEVIVWKTVTHFKVLQEVLPTKKIEHFQLMLYNGNELKAIVSYRKHDYLSFLQVDILEKKIDNFFVKLTNDVKTIGANVSCFFDISSSEYFCVVHGSFMFIFSLKDLHIKQRHEISKSRYFTSVACHPTEKLVLTGDSDGRVIVWQGIFSSNSAQSVYHWHTLPVKCVSFSFSGSYFYSGGQECVLVKWNQEDSTDKTFLPRLSAPIEHITTSKDNVFLAVATKNNTVKILDSKFNIVSLIQQIVVGSHFKCGILFDPRTKALIMNGDVGHVQFYSPQDKSLLYNVDIVGQNKITNERNCKIENTEIIRFAISRTGLWLAAVEERKDVECYREIRLKFWKFEEKSQIFQLNTSVEYPHEKSITSMLFQPTNKEDKLRCVTVGSDRKFKVWQLIETLHISETRQIWQCLGVGFFRDLPCCGLSFSMDGSLMAIGFGPLATAWVPEIFELKCSLVHPMYRENITNIQFGNRNQCHLLVTTTKTQLCVWNLLTLIMIWSVPVRASLLVADILTSNMAVITGDRKIFIFSPLNPQPTYSDSDILKHHDHIVAAIFVPTKFGSDTNRLKWYEQSYLYFINSENELFCLSNSDEDIEDIGNTEETEMSLFKAMMPNIRTNGAVVAAPLQHIYEKDATHKDIKKYLEATIHTMAPIRYTCSALIQSLVLDKKNAT